MKRDTEVVVWRLNDCLDLSPQVFINFAMGKTDTDEQEVTEGTDIDSLDSYNALDR